MQKFQVGTSVELPQSCKVGLRLVPPPRAGGRSFRHQDRSCKEQSSGFSVWKDPLLPPGRFSRPRCSVHVKVHDSLKGSQNLADLRSPPGGANEEEDWRALDGWIHLSLCQFLCRKKNSANSDKLGSTKNGVQR